MVNKARSSRVKPFVIALAWCLVTLHAWALNTLKDVRIQKGELRLEFRYPVAKKQIKHFSLSNPPRAVVDIKHCRLGCDRKLLNKLRKKGIRIAERNAKSVRVVVESSKPYRCLPYQPLFEEKYYHIPLPKQTTTPKASKTRTKPRLLKKSKITKHPAIDHSKELIVIDAGHGGHDTGAVAGGKREKDLVLQIAKRVEKALRKRGFKVYLTRRTDRFLKLPQRTKIADKKGATVFVSIHANSVPKRKRHKVHGIETFFLQNTRDEKSKRIAARENAAVLKGMSKISKEVVVDAVLNGPKIIESNKLAIDVQREMITRLRRHFKGVRDGGVRHAPFWVLVGASRPSILIEVGYISHPKERKRLFNPRYQQLLAEGIAAGIESYLIKRKKELGF